MVIFTLIAPLHFHLDSVDLYHSIPSGLNHATDDKEGNLLHAEAENNRIEVCCASQNPVGARSFA